MKTMVFPLLLTMLILMLPGCQVAPESQPGSTTLPGDVLAEPTLSSQPMNDANHDDAFQTFIETWKLSNLISEGLTMTAEHKDAFMKYFQEFDDVTRNYVILLLQGISAGTITVTDDYNDPESGVYLSRCQVCLYDMDQDGTPELILKTGACEADSWFTVYTLVDGELIACGELSGSHADLYAGDLAGFVRYAGHMGVYDITISTLAGQVLTTQTIAEGEPDSGENEDYPELEAYGYGSYSQPLQFDSLPILFLAPAG